jgi:hypothetical protein
MDLDPFLLLKSRQPPRRLPPPPPPPPNPPASVILKGVLLCDVLERVFTERKFQSLPLAGFASFCYQSANGNLLTVYGAVLCWDNAKLAVEATNLPNCGKAAKLWL